MAQIYLSSGENYGIVGAGSNTINGTNGNEIVDVAANGDAIFDGSFNRGGDIINIAGNAAAYVASISGAYLILTSTTGASNGARIEIPIGEGNGASVKFADATTARVINATGAVVTLGGQVIAPGGTPVNGGNVTPGTDSEIFLTAQQDIKTGTAGSDTFWADMLQVDGRQVNSLGTGDRLEGGAGTDVLEAQITRAATFDGNTGVGGTNGGSNIPVQPRLNNIEIVKIEALNADLAPGQLPSNITVGNSDIQAAIIENPLYDYSNNTEVFFNAKNVRGHNEIWSWYSDANLTVQDLTTIVSDGGHDDARNTSEMTIGMGYTSGQDTFWDSSDYHVFFDQDFLLIGQSNESRINFFLLDEAAELVGAPRLQHIDVDGVRFTVNGGPPITLSDPDAQTAGTHAGFIAALQDALQDLKDAGLVPADTELFLDPTRTDTTFLDNGTESGLIPAIVLRTNTSAVFAPVGFSRVEDAPGAYDVYGDFDTLVTVEDLPLSVNIALEKVGRGGEGGDLIVGSMDKYHHGIDVFDVTVYGDDSRPSYLDYLNSTGDGESGIGGYGDLDVINIVSDNTGYPDDDTYASLTIASTNANLTTIDATGFLGDLVLGNEYDVQDLKTLRATGGGDVEFYGEISSNLPGAFSYTTGAGDDTIDLEIFGTALEYAQSSLYVETGAGDDDVYLSSYFQSSSNYQLTFTLLDLDGTGAPQGGVPIEDDDVATVTINDFFAPGQDFTFQLIGASSAATTTEGLAQEIVSIINGQNSPWSAYVGTTNGDGTVPIVLDYDYGSSPAVVPTVSISFDEGGDGNPPVIATSQFLVSGIGSATSNPDGEQFPNHVILDNVDVITGDGADVVETYGQGAFHIKTGNDNDVIYSEQSGGTAAWVFNVDRGEYDGTSDPLFGLGGVPLRYSLLDGATVRVTFSGAGSNLGGDGGGVMQDSGLAAALGDALQFVNGIEGSTTIDVAGGKYFGTQQDINNAVVKIINDHPVLSKLLTATIGANNTLIVQTQIDGIYVTQDLDITVSRLPAYQSGSTTTWPVNLINEAVTLGLINSNTVPAGANPSTTAAYAQVVGAALDNGFYAGIDNDRVDPSFDNLYYSGYSGYYEADHIHSPGNGSDVVVLSTQDDTAGPNGYWTLDGWLYDDASNETIVLEGDLFSGSTTGTGDTIINFQVAGEGLYTNEDPNEVPSGRGTPNGGFDFLDFTAYLTSQFSPSGSTLSRDPIPTTLDDLSSGAGAPGSGLVDVSGAVFNANEVMIVDFIKDTGQTWAGLDAGKLQNIINDTAAVDAWGSLDDGDFSLDDSGIPTGIGTTIVNGEARAIIMVQNDDNLGEYKVFEVRWDDDSTDTTTDPQALVSFRGILDFGATLNGLDELNLVGSAEYANFNFDVSAMIP